MAQMHVELVAPDSNVWTGEATMVIVKTTEGDLGILPGHEPVLASLVNGPVEIRPVDGPAVRAAVLGGFLSVAGDTVSILAERARLASDLVESDVRAALAEAEQTGDAEAASQARAQLRAIHGR